MASPGTAEGQGRRMQGAFQRAWKARKAAHKLLSRTSRLEQEVPLPLRSARGSGAARTGAARTLQAFIRRCAAVQAERRTRRVHSPDMHVASSPGSSVCPDFDAVGLAEAKEEAKRDEEGNGECPGDGEAGEFREEMTETLLANVEAPVRSDAEPLEHLTTRLGEALEWSALELEAKDAALEVARRNFVRVTQENRASAAVLAKSRQELEDLKREHTDVIESWRSEMARLQGDLAAKDAALEAAKRDLEALTQEHSREALRAVEAARRELEVFAEEHSREVLRAAGSEASAGETIARAHDSLTRAFAALSASNDEIYSLREDRARLVGLVHEQTAKAGCATSGVRELLLEVSLTSGDIVETLREIAVCHARASACAAQVLATREEESKLFGQPAAGGEHNDNGRDAVIAALHTEIGALKRALREERPVMEEERLAITRFRSMRADAGTCPRVCTHAARDGESETLSGDDGSCLPGPRDSLDDNHRGEGRLQESWAEKQVCHEEEDPSLGASHEECAEEPEREGPNQQTEMCSDQAWGFVFSQQKLVNELAGHTSPGGGTPSLVYIRDADSIQPDPHSNLHSITQGSNILASGGRLPGKQSKVRGAADVATVCGHISGPELAAARASSQTHNGRSILLAEKLLGEIRGAVVEIVVLHAAVEMESSALGLRASASPQRLPPTKYRSAAAENIKLRAELESANLEVQGLERALKASRRESSSWMSAKQEARLDVLSRKLDTPIALLSKSMDRTSSAVSLDCRSPSYFEMSAAVVPRRLAEPIESSQREPETTLEAVYKDIFES